MRIRFIEGYAISTNKSLREWSIRNSDSLTQNRKEYQVFRDHMYYFENGYEWIGESDDLEKAKKIAYKNRDRKEVPIICRKEDTDFSVSSYSNTPEGEPAYAERKNHAEYWYYDWEDRAWYTSHYENPYERV